MRWVTAQNRQLHFLIEKSRQEGDSSSRASFQLKKNERFLLPQTVSVHDSIVLRESPICGDGFFSICRHLAFVSPTVVLPTTSSDRASYWAPPSSHNPSKKIVTKTEKQKSERHFLQWAGTDKVSRWDGPGATAVRWLHRLRLIPTCSLLPELGRNILFCQQSQAEIFSFARESQAGIFRKIFRKDFFWFSGRDGSLLNFNQCMISFSTLIRHLFLHLFRSWKESTCSVTFKWFPFQCRWPS